MGYRLDEILMIFAVYSILGWLVNICFFYITEKKLDRRSICKGPYSAAFGTGATLMIFCNAYAPKYLSAIFGVGVCTGLLVQSIASLAIRLLSGKWIVLHKWYLIPLFGIINVLLFYQIQPFMGALIANISPWVRMVLLLAYWMTFVPDFIEGMVRLLDYKAAQVKAAQKEK